MTSENQKAKATLWRKHWLGWLKENARRAPTEDAGIWLDMLEASKRARGLTFDVIQALERYIHRFGYAYVNSPQGRKGR